MTPPLLFRGNTLLSEKSNMPICNPLKNDHTWLPYCLNLSIRLLEVDYPCLRENLGILVLIETGPAA